MADVKVLTHSSIRIAGDQVIYVDPFEVKEEIHDADMILITHDHFDHFSAADIRKVEKEGTVLVMPESMKGMEAQTDLEKVYFVKPWGGSLEMNGVKIDAVPAYNVLKPFHPKGKNFVGYLILIGGVTYYVAGDTDCTRDSKKVKCDVALVPVGGKYTMDHKEAAKLVNEIRPKVAIPTHYGTVAGSPDDGRKFAQLTDDGIIVKIQL